MAPSLNPKAVICAFAATMLFNKLCQSLQMPPALAIAGQAVIVVCTLRLFQNFATQPLPIGAVAPSIASLKYVRGGDAEEADDEGLKAADGKKDSSKAAAVAVANRNARGFRKGHVTVIDFWASWCVPCQKALPELNRYWKRKRKEAADDGDADACPLTIIGVSSEAESRVREFCELFGSNYTFPCAVDEGAVVNAVYPKPYIPYAYVIGKDGLVAWHGHSAGVEVEVERALLRKWRGDEDVSGSNDQTNAAETKKEK